MHLGIDFNISHDDWALPPDELAMRIFDPAARCLADEWTRRDGGPFFVEASSKPIYSVEVKDGPRVDDMRAAIIAAAESLRPNV